MRLNQFQFIVALEKHKNLSRVSEELYISQPSISKAIKELEAEVGYKILKRNKEGMVFTQQGRQVLQYAKEIMERVALIRGLDTYIDPSVKEKLTLGVTRFLSEGVFSEILWELKERYPNLTVQFNEDYSSQIIQVVAAGQLDLGIIMMYSSDEKSTRSMLEQLKLQYVQLFTDEVQLYVNNNHPLCTQPIVTIEAVNAYPYVTSGNAVVAESSKALLNKYGYQREIEIINNRAMLLKYIETYKGLTSMPSLVYKRHPDYKKNLRPLKIIDFQWHCQVGYISQQRILSGTEKAFIQSLQQLMQ